MLTKFDILYTGHVDMENVGYGGTPVMSRDFPNEVLVTAFDKAEEIAKTADRLGFETFWAAEHHFQREGYECLPNLLMLYLHLAHVTERIKFGCGFNITPMWHPLRLAEDFAVADILTKGRVTFGVGRGYHTREVESLGGPMLDKDANREIFEEQVDILFKARDFLEKNDIPVVFQGRKGAGSNIALHFLDPDGYEFEIYCGLDQIDETGRSRPSEQYRRVSSLEDAVANPLPKTW